MSSEIDLSPTGVMSMMGELDRLRAELSCKESEWAKIFSTLRADNARLQSACNKKTELLRAVRHSMDTDKPFPSLEKITGIEWTDPGDSFIGVDWVVVGGESGPRRRDCGVGAINSIANQCIDAEVACFVKQDYAAKPGQKGRLTDDVWELKQYPRANL